LERSEFKPTEFSETPNQRFTRLVLPHLDAAYALARALAGNRADAEDIVQEACIRAFRAVGASNIANPRAWTLTIVHNMALTWLAKNRPAAIIAVDILDDAELHSSQAGDFNTPEAAVIAKTEAEQLDAAISQLPLVYKETLLLRDVEGLNYKEIAEVTNVPIGTVMSRLTRARSRVAAILGGKKT
jgi:RNA polymerase sigma-70 factor (ECF subfamily)